MNGPGRPCSLGRSRVPVYRSEALSSMEVGRSPRIGFGAKNGSFGERGLAQNRTSRTVARLHLGGVATLTPRDMELWASTT